MFEDQIAAIDKFSQMRVGALFMGMGTGKTRTALELCRHNQDEVDLVLWLAPKSTIANLKAELSQCEPLSIPLEAYGYETLASSDKQYIRLLDRLKGRRIFLICDESLYLKNGETKRWRRPTPGIGPVQVLRAGNVGQSASSSQRSQLWQHLRSNFSIGRPQAGQA